jgi:hypothetical protein
MTRRIAIAAVLVLAALAALALYSGRQPRERQLLREVYSPTFAAVPAEAPIGATITAIADDLASPAGQDFLGRLLPDQAGVLWITCLVALIVAFDFSRLRNPRNLDIAIFIALALVLFDNMRFFRIALTPVSWRLLDSVYAVVFLLNAALLLRALRQAAAPQSAAEWRPNLRGRALAGCALLLVACSVLTALQRDPDDAGYFTNLGGQRLRERGRLPYGDPLLTGTPGAAYGPLMYAAHVPFQVLIEPRPPNPSSPDRPPLGAAANYYLPPPLATKLCTVAFHLAGVLALFVAARRLTGDDDVGWGLVALYCGSAFVLGIGGTNEYIGGITFISHVAPAAATLVAFACLPLPAIAGVTLAASVGLGFYPAFMLPAWAGYYWRDRRQCLRFLAGFAVAAAIVGGATLALSQPAGGRGRMGTVLHDTLGHHTDPHGYGRSPFGFWGQRGGVRHWLIAPAIGESSLTSPAYLLLFLLVGGSFFMARHASAAGLALLTATVAIAFSLLKIQPTGTYIAWSYPFLLIGFFAARPPAAMRSNQLPTPNSQLPNRSNSPRPGSWELEVGS